MTLVLTGRVTLSKQSSGEPIFPRGDENAIEFTGIRDVPGYPPRIEIVVLVVFRAANDELADVGHA